MRPFRNDQIRKHRILRTRALCAREEELTQWLVGAHRPSEGEYLESLVRSQLREVLPSGIAVSSGFISGLVEVQAPGQGQDVQRHLSKQFDVIVWDRGTFPPLFERDELAVVSPSSVVAIIEVTSTLTPKKLATDLEKLDSVSWYYNRYLSPFRPFTAVVGFGSCKSWVSTMLRRMERYFHYDSNVSPVQRSWMNSEPLRAGGQPTAGFVDIVAALDDNGGLIVSEQKHCQLNPHGQHIRCVGYDHEDSKADAWGVIEHYVAWWAMVRNQRGGLHSPDVTWERPRSVYRSAKEELWLTSSDFDQWRINARELSTTAIRNVSDFAVVNQSSILPDPRFFVRGFGPDPDVSNFKWSIEAYSADLVAVGYYQSRRRVKKWRVRWMVEGGAISGWCCPIGVNGEWSLEFVDREPYVGSFEDCMRSLDASAWVPA